MGRLLVYYIARYEHWLLVNSNIFSSNSVHGQSEFRDFLSSLLSPEPDAFLRLHQIGAFRKPHDLEVGKVRKQLYVGNLEVYYLCGKVIAVDLPSSCAYFQVYPLEHAWDSMDKMYEDLI